MKAYSKIWRGSTGKKTGGHPSKRESREIDGVLELRCRDCAAWKPATVYSENETSKFGRVSRCRPCNAQYQMALKRRRRLKQAASQEPRPPSP